MTVLRVLDQEERTIAEGQARSLSPSLLRGRMSMGR